MKSILVVDDEPVLLRNLVRYLGALGYEVRSAGNGREALAAVGEFAPDILITDINMPDFDGIELLNALRRRSEQVPVIAMSGGGQFDRRLLLESARLLGAVVTLQKPFELDALRSAVESALGAGPPPEEPPG